MVKNAAQKNGVARSEEWSKRKLKLNHERYAEEGAMGMHEKGAKKGKGNPNCCRERELRLF